MSTQSVQPSIPLPQFRAPTLLIEDAWYKEARREGFANDIEQNIAELLSSDKALRDPDGGPKFIEILKKDIVALREVAGNALSAECDRLEHQLGDVVVRITQITLAPVRDQEEGRPSTPVQALIPAPKATTPCVKAAEKDVAACPDGGAVPSVAEPVNVEPRPQPTQEVVITPVQEQQKVLPLPPIEKTLSQRLQTVRQELVGLTVEAAGGKERALKVLEAIQGKIEGLRGELKDEPKGSPLKEELRQLNIRVQEAASRIHGEDVYDLAEGVVPLPSLGKLVNPVELCSANETPTNVGLRILEERGFLVRRIKGNGHCLFGSIAAQLLTVEGLEGLKARLPSLRERGLVGSIQAEEFVERCLRELAAGRSVESFITDEAVYNEWVKLLRTVASLWWRVLPHTPEEMRNVVTAIRDEMPSLKDVQGDKEVFDRYLQDISSIETRSYGGSPETQALMEALGLEIKIVNVPQLGSVPDFAEELLPRGIDLGTLWIMYRPGHYDALCFPI